MNYPEVERELFFKGWPKPAKADRCTCRPDGDYGPISVRVTMADGREFSATFVGVLRSPHSSDVMQVDFDTIRLWADGTVMSAVERRQVALLIVQSHEAQLYAGEADLLERPPTDC